MNDKNTNEPNQAKDSLVNSFNQSPSSIFTSKVIIALIVAVLLGIGSGYLLGQKSGTSVGKVVTKDGQETSVGGKAVFGSGDLKVFKDTATGELKVGGINGEGAFHLVRPGGASQNVYLTSSVVDLSQFVGKKIKVWGETQKAKVAGWLMDVGRVEVL